MTTSALIIHDTFDTYVRHLLPFRDFSTLTFALTRVTPLFLFFSDFAIVRWRIVGDQDLSILRGHLLFEISPRLDRPISSASKEKEKGISSEIGRSWRERGSFFFFILRMEEQRRRRRRRRYRSISNFQAEKRKKGVGFRLKGIGGRESIPRSCARKY